MFKQAVALIGGPFLLYSLFPEQETQSEMDDRRDRGGSLDNTVLLGEYLSTTTYILRNMKSHQMKPGDCVPILEHLQKDLASTVNLLRDSLARSNLPTEDVTRATAYLNKVDAVLQEMPGFLSILRKYPKGNQDLDMYVPAILTEFTQLATNIGSVLKKRNG